MSERVKKTVTIGYGVLALILLAVLVIGVLSGGVFASVALPKLTQNAAPVAGQTPLPARAWIGVTYVPLTPASARSHNVSVTAGALVVAVTPNSPAAKADVREDDIITSVDGRMIDDSTSMMDTIRDKKPGDSVKVTLLRGGSELTVGLVLERSPVGPGARGDRSPFDRLRRGFTRIFSGD